LTWSLKWGNHVKAFELQFKKSGVMPAPLKSRPRLKVVDLPFYEAFECLSSSRPSGFNTVAAIPVSEVLAYCVLVGIVNKRARAKYLSLVQDMDQVCLKHWADAQDKSQPKK
jgi:hypothetical protein